MPFRIWSMMSNELPANGLVADAPESASSRTLPLRERWGDSLDLGFAAVPSVLLTSFASLGITSTEFLVLLVLVSHWHSGDTGPYPRVSTIARRLGTTPRTVQRALTGLRKAGLLNWERVQVLDGRILRHAPPGVGVRRRVYEMRHVVERAARLAEARRQLRDSGYRIRKSPASGESSKAGGAGVHTQPLA